MPNPLGFNHVFRKDVYETNTKPACYLIVEGIGVNRKFKIEYRDGRKVSDEIKTDILEEFRVHNNNDTALILLKSLIKNLSKENNNAHVNSIIRMAEKVVERDI